VTDLLLVPSPLLGPSSWEPVAEWLTSRGLPARVVGTTGVRSPGELVAAVAAAAGVRPVVLVPHSNAGLAVPALGALVDLRATVFVDAALAPDSGTTAMAPEDLAARLRELSDDRGVLPPWTDWWDDLTGVFPDEAAQERVAAGQPRLPLSYFADRLPVPAGWAERPCGYLAFGETYAEETAFARTHGWPVTVLPGRHLHQLHDPGAVGDAVLALLDRLTA
jgi:hypothetical protein